jgi:hypothetical protein
MNRDRDAVANDGGAADNLFHTSDVGQNIGLPLRLRVVTWRVGSSKNRDNVSRQPRTIWRDERCRVLTQEVAWNDEVTPVLADQNQIGTGTMKLATK